MNPFPHGWGRLLTEATLAICIIDAENHIANTMELFVHDQASDQVLALQLCLVGYCFIINLLPTWAADCHYVTIIFDSLFSKTEDENECLKTFQCCLQRLQFYMC